MRYLKGNDRDYILLSVVAAESYCPYPSGISCVKNKWGGTSECHLDASYNYTVIGLIDRLSESVVKSVTDQLIYRDMSPTERTGKEVLQAMIESYGLETPVMLLKINDEPLAKKTKIKKPDLLKLDSTFYPSTHSPNSTNTLNLKLNYTIA